MLLEIVAYVLVAILVLGVLLALLGAVAVACAAWEWLSEVYEDWRHPEHQIQPPASQLAAGPREPAIPGLDALARLVEENGLVWVGTAHRAGKLGHIENIEVLAQYLAQVCQRSDPKDVQWIIHSRLWAAHKAWCKAQGRENVYG